MLILDASFALMTWLALHGGLVALWTALGVGGVALVILTLQLVRA